jgi:hypothetical protein
MGRALSEPPPQARRWVAGRSRQPCATSAVVGPEHRAAADARASVGLCILEGHVELWRPRGCRERGGESLANARIGERDDLASGHGRIEEPRLPNARGEHGDGSGKTDARRLSCTTSERMP